MQSRASLWFAVAGLTALVATSCTKRATETPQQPGATAAAPVAEPDVAQQAEAVRAGQSDQIRLDETLVSDGDLTHLAGLEDKLRRINLSRTTISDAGLTELAKFKHLEQLRLASPQITDAGLATLAQLHELKHLHLIGAPISDAGLAHLHGLQGLSSLYLDGTRATEDGMSKLVEALPGVHLHFDGGHHPGDQRADDHDHQKP